MSLKSIKIIAINILNKFNKFPNWVKLICLYVPIILSSYYINHYFPSLTDSLDNYSFIILSLLLLYVIYNIFETLLMISFIIDKNYILENKIYKYIPSFLKQRITIFKNLNNYNKKVILNTNLFIVIMNLFLVFIGIITLNCIYFY